MSSKYFILKNITIHFLYQVSAFKQTTTSLIASLTHGGPVARGDSPPLIPRSLCRQTLGQLAARLTKPGVNYSGDALPPMLLKLPLNSVHILQMTPFRHPESVIWVSK